MIASVHVKIAELGLPHQIMGEILHFFCKFCCCLVAGKVWEKRKEQ